MSDPAAPTQPVLNSLPSALWRPTLYLVAIVLCGMWLRCWQVTESLWLDELHTSWVVADSVADIPERARAGNQSPLYFYIVWGVVQLCGHTQWALRLTSLVSGIALIVAVAQLVQRWTGSASAGLLAALLLALNRDCIFFAQEARPYALVQLSALGHAAIFVAMLKRPTGTNRLMFVAGAVWLFYLHYTAFLLLIAEAVGLVVLLAARHSHVKYRLSQAACDVLLIALMLLPAATHLLVIAQRRDNWARIVQAWPPPFTLQVAILLFGVLPFAAVLCGVALRWKRGSFKLGSVPGVWALCWFLVPVLLAWLATLGHVAALCMVRYLVASVAGAIVFAALCQSVFSSRWYRAALATLLVAGSLFTSGIVPQLCYDQRVIGDRNEAWDEATVWLNAELQRSPKPVFLCAGLLEDLALESHADPQLKEYCLFPLSGIYQLHAPHLEPLPTSPRALLSPLQRQWVQRQQGLWVIVRAGPKTTASITASLAHDLRHAGLDVDVVQQHHFGTLKVLLLSAK